MAAKAEDALEGPDDIGISSYSYREHVPWSRQATKWSGGGISKARNADDGLHQGVMVCGPIFTMQQRCRASDLITGRRGTKDRP
ncbi:hypothetical protein C9E91_15715 [Rhizobium sp. SEMIA4064]|nr:hypothetical protein C9E91_15715 [Rhizobium sp. SEMIA4064]